VSGGPRRSGLGGRPSGRGFGSSGVGVGGPGELGGLGWPVTVREAGHDEFGAQPRQLSRSAVMRCEPLAGTTGQASCAADGNTCRLSNTRSTLAS